MKTNLACSFILAALSLCFAECGPPVTSIAYTFTTLDFPPDPVRGNIPLVMTRALGVNDSDAIVGTYLMEDGFVRDFHGFLRAPTTGTYSQIDLAGDDTN